jgi:hypothetical protein
VSAPTGHQHLDHRGHETGQERRNAQHAAAVKPKPGKAYRVRHKFGDVWRYCSGHGIRRWNAARFWARDHFLSRTSADEKKRWKAAQVAYGKKAHAAKLRAKASADVHDGGDDVTVSLLPRAWNAAKYAIGGYGAGLFQTWATMVKAFPHAHHVYYAISASDTPHPSIGAAKVYLDMEPGDATPAQFPGWYRAMRNLGWEAHQLGGYCSVSQGDVVVAAAAAAGIDPSEFDLQCAHYGQGKHVCSRNCFSGFHHQADSTQWTDRFNGVSLDATHYLHF